jgi:hypothetical protein
MGAEVGARLFLGDPGMSLEVGFARFDEGDDWLSIGYTGGLGEDVDSSSASLTFLGGLGFVLYGIIVPIMAL